MAVKSLKCLTCGGDLQFKPTLQKWQCDWCDSEFEEKDLEVDELSASKNDSIETVETMDNSEIKVYKCSYCGAEVVTDTVTAATFCVYCQRPIVVGSQFSGILKPDVLIPFKNTKDQAMKTFKEYLKGKRFLPNEYKSDQNIEKLSGIYIPFWLYDATIDFNVHGEGEIVTHRRSGDYNIKRTDVYNIAREGSIRIDNIPVDASSKTPNDIMDSIEPFDFTALIDFSTNYLSGFLAEKYDDDKDKSFDRAKYRFEGSAENMINSSLSKYSSVRRSINKKRLDNITSRYGLLPVWILYSNFNGEQYIFAMNGQTGKLTGNLPVDSSKIFKYFIMMFVISSVFGAIAGAIFQLIS